MLQYVEDVHVWTTQYMPLFTQLTVSIALAGSQDLVPMSEHRNAKQYREWSVYHALGRMT